MAPDGLPSLMLKRLSSRSLESLLAAGPLPAGEAVTVLAPLALALAELHRVGVTHGGIRPSAVLFDAEGAPVLARFGSAGVLGELPSPDAAGLPAARLAAEPGVASDLRRFAAVCRATLGDAAAGLDGVLRGEESDAAVAADPQAWLQELADRLFGLADPEPVRFVRESLPGQPAPDGRPALPARIAGAPITGARVTGAPMTGAESVADEPAPFASPLREALALLHLPDSLRESVIGPLADRLSPLLESGPLATLRPRLHRALRSVRRPVWIVAGVVALAVVAAMATMPGGSSEAGAPEPVLTPVAEEPPATAAPQAADSAIGGDDPLAAAGALLATRAACLGASSILCLGGADQPGSAASEADAYRIRIAQEGGIRSPEPSLTGAEAVLVDRLGDSALLSLDRAGVTVASLLLVRTERGWRIRDLVFADDVEPASSP